MDGDAVEPVGGSFGVEADGCYGDVEFGDCGGEGDEGVEDYGVDAGEVGDGFAGEVCAEVGSDDEDGVCFVFGEDVNSAGFAGVVVDDAAGVVDGVGVACGEGEHLVGAVDVPVSAEGGEGVFGVPVEFVDEFDAGADVFVFAAGLGEADAGEEGSEFGVEEDVGGFEEDAAFYAGDGVGDDAAFAADDGPECVEEGVVSAGFDLDEDVGEFGGFGFADVDDDDGAVAAAFGPECAGGVGGVAGEVARVSGDGVAAPVDDDVCAVFDLAEGAAGVADFLDGHDGGAVAFGGAVVHDGADFFGDFEADVHGFGGGAGPAVEEGTFGVGEHFGGHSDGGVKVGFFPLVSFAADGGDHSAGGAEFAGGEEAAVDDVGDDAVFDVEFDVVTEAAAEGACVVFDDGFAGLGAGEGGAGGYFVSEAAEVFHEVPGGFEGEVGGGDVDGDSFEVGRAGGVGVFVEDEVCVRAAGDEYDSFGCFRGFPDVEYGFSCGAFDEDVFAFFDAEFHHVHGVEEAVGGFAGVVVGVFVIQLGALFGGSSAAHQQFHECPCPRPSEGGSGGLMLLCMYPGAN